MIRILAIILSLFFVAQAQAACTGSSPTWTSTPDYTSVAACVAGATAGDTINVSAGDGTETWESVLTLTRGLVLAGPGSTNLTITSNQSSHIRFEPSSTGIAADDVFEVSGFRFESESGMSAGAIGLIMANSVTDYMSNIKIHDNHFYGISTGYGAIHVDGHFFGVVYSNTFEDCLYVEKGLGNHVNSWANLSLDRGTALNMYYEDNTITGTGMFSMGHGGRYVARYNTWDGDTDNNAFECHGNQCGGAVCGTMVVEMYGNLYSNDDQNSYQVQFRGGRVLAFHNSFPDAGASLVLREEESDTCDPCGAYEQHITDSYFWNNRSSTGLETFTILQNAGDTQIAENTNFFNHNTSFNGTAGMGCGTAATMNAIETCTDGVGFWVPNASIDSDASSCSDLTGYTGANNTLAAGVNGNIGTLYKCASNEWVSYYTPYEYPHPLRGAGDETPPSVTITTSDPSAITTDSATVEGTSTGEAASCKFRIGSAPDVDNGTACTGTTEWTCNTSGYTIGANTLYVGCGDAAGNWGSDSITVNYNRVKPIITLNVGPVWTLQ